MRKKIFLAVLFCAATVTSGMYSQDFLYSGSLTCTIGETQFSGKITSAIYMAADDVLNFNIENGSGGLFQFAISRPQKMIQEQSPFTANYEVQYPMLTANSEDKMFYFTYNRDKSRTENNYVMLNAQFKLNRFDLADKTIQFEFSAVVITGVLQPDATFRETDRLIIENGTTDNIKFMGL